MPNMHPTTCALTASHCVLFCSDVSLSGICARRPGPSRDHRTGYFDGPLAWRLATAALAKAVRTDADKAYYRKAERIQTEHRLPDGCPADQYGVWEGGS